MSLSRILSRKFSLGLLTIGFTLYLLGCGPTPDNQNTIVPQDEPANDALPPSSSTEPAPALARNVPLMAKVEGDRPSESGAASNAPRQHKRSSPFRFAEIARESGIDFQQFSGMTPSKYQPTAHGSGVAMFDADGDGKLDLYFATGNLLPLKANPSARHSNRLYKNLGNGKFRDVTEASGLGFAGFCHGVTIGDIDNDGDPDVHLANYGANALYLNNGDGTFRDIAKEAGLAGRPNNWSSGGAFLDYDNDGDLDLYVSNYGEWLYPQDDVFCGDEEKGVRIYCSPRLIRTVKHYLYRNNGDKTFTEVTDAAGVGRSDGHGFGVVAADVNSDGQIDLYVANDLNPNFLFLNKGDGTFEDATGYSGASLDEKGQAQSGMGVDAEDVNGDSLPELFVTNFDNEYNTLYRNFGKGAFVDSTFDFNLAADTYPNVGWGCALVDLNNDGWPDNFVANGHVDDNRAKLGETTDYAEFPTLFVNLAGRRFHLATRDAGPYFETKHVGRGAAFGDIDDDGDVDIIINHKDGPPALLRNDTKTNNRWIRLVLQGTKSNRDAVGARIEVVIPGNTLEPRPDAKHSAHKRSHRRTATIHRQRKGGGSLESAHDPRVLIGVGRAEEVTKLTVRWPSGAVTTLENVETNRTHKIVEPR